MVTELLSGANLEDVKVLRAADIEQALGGLPAMKRHAAQLAADALRALMLDFQSKTGT
jgi:NifU-like protein involved in Fe-S cluster formation